MKECLYCGNPVKNKFCGVSCQNRFQKRKISEESIRKGLETRDKKWKDFSVACYICKNDFTVKEFNVESPKKDKYFCSRKCSCIYSSNVNKKYRIDKISKAFLLKYPIESRKTINRKPIIKRNPKDQNIEKVKRIKKVTKFTCLYCKEDGVDKKNKGDRRYHYECWLKISGGLKKGSSRGKSGWYKGYWCDSSYELAFVIYNLDHNIEFKRNTEGFPYIYKGIERKFYPDFYSIDSYIEIKNFHSEETDEKIRQFKGRIKILYKEDLKEEILPYTIDKYGKDFIRLYGHVE